MEKILEKKFFFSLKKKFSYFLNDPSKFWITFEKNMLIFFLDGWIYFR